MKRSMVLCVVVSVVMLAFLLIACGDGGGGGGKGPTPATKMAVALRGVGQVAIVDLSDYSVAATYHVGTGPQSIAISPDKSTFYVTDNADNNWGPGLLWVVNVEDGASTAVYLGGSLWGVKVHPDGSKVYVSDWENGEIVVVDTATKDILLNLSVGDMPVGLAISKDGSKLCVPNKNDDTVTIINTATYASVTSSVLGGTGSGPWEVAFNPDGTQCWVDDSSEGDLLSVVDASDASIIASTTLEFIQGSGDGLHGISFTPDGTKAFVGSVYGPDMFVINTATLETIQRIDTGAPDGGYAKRMVMDPLGKTLYQSTHEGDYILMVDVATNAVASTTIDFNTDDKPNGVVLY